MRIEANYSIITQNCNKSVLTIHYLSMFDASYTENTSHAGSGQSKRTLNQNKPSNGQPGISATPSRYSITQCSFVMYITYYHITSQTFNAKQCYPPVARLIDHVYHIYHITCDSEVLCLW